MTSTIRAARLGALSLLVLGLVAACGSGRGEPGASAATAAPAESIVTSAPDLEALIIAAQAEGELTFYSSQATDSVDAVAAAFEAKYGIEVKTARMVDSELTPRVETEMSTGADGADVVLNASEGWVREQAAKGAFLKLTASPQLKGLGDYDAAQYVHDDLFFETGAAVLTFGWNTDLVPDGLSDYPDLLDPELAGGRIAVPDPAVGPALVDFYLWLVDNFGDDYLEKLAAQKPRIYPSALPIAEALSSGEVYASAYAGPAQLVPAAANGAPVDFGISDSGARGARYFAMIPAGTNSPNAAQLFADFLVTEEAQQLSQQNIGSVLPEIKGAVITNDRVRHLDLEATAPGPAAAFVEKWNALFR